MERLSFAGFEVDFDAQATRAAWAAVPRGAAEACGCALCAAFVAAREELLTDELRAVLDTLGLDGARESELALLERTERPPEARVTVAWAFAGALRGGPEGEGPVRFAEAPVRAPAGLVGGPLVALELELWIPMPAPAPAKAR